LSGYGLAILPIPPAAPNPRPSAGQAARGASANTGGFYFVRFKVEKPISDSSSKRKQHDIQIQPQPELQNILSQK
jgi:hypothetical protein